MATSAKRPSRLHHTAYVTRDLEATRAFYEDVIGLPLVATWCEIDELFGARRVYCHLFFELADGGALAFFKFANPQDEELFSRDGVPETRSAVPRGRQDTAPVRAEFSPLHGLFMTF